MKETDMTMLVQTEEFTFSSQSVIEAADLMSHAG